MSSAVQRQETVLHEALLTHFRENKVEIANAVTKPFPFLESLRDRALITDKLYDVSRASCQLRPGDLASGCSPPCFSWGDPVESLSHPEG